MSIFDNFEIVDDSIVNNSWIEWDHTDLLKTLHHLEVG